MRLRKTSDAAEGPLSAKAAELLGALGSLESMLVAFSGGVDSSLLLAAAVEASRGEVLAATASSPIHPARELAEARRIAALIGARHEIVRTRELADPRFTTNPLDRCYHCKRALFARFKQMAGERGLRAMVEGSTVEDLSDFRPGEQALRELEILSPLRQADFTKREVRDLARAIGLPNWNRAASACLASRFPYGTEITYEALQRIERLEDMLLGLGFCQVRARYHGEMVRLEIEPEALALAVRPDIRDRIVQAARREGFRFVALDLQGYRMGSLNPEGT
jgi:uncharacterized protein